MTVLQGKLINFFRVLFFVAVIIAAGFISCLTAMRFAIRGSEVAVPNLMGKSIQEAAGVLSGMELHLKVEGYRFDDRMANDRVLSQIPSPTSRLKTNRSVRVLVSLGTKKVMVPDVHGESLRASQITLLRRGLTMGVSSALASETIEKDHIISQDPLPQTQHAQSPVVNLLVSQGKKNRVFLMPDVIGMEWDEVLKSMERAGIPAGKITYQLMAGIARGTILKQSIPPGARLLEGDPVDYEVSK
jgi:serine/threonine-protein kinase